MLRWGRSAELIVVPRSRRANRFRDRVRRVPNSAQIFAGRTFCGPQVTPHISDPLVGEVAVRGTASATVRADTIASMDVHAHNTFERPDAVRAGQTHADPLRGGVLVHTFPPASVTRLTFSL
jgi:alpha-N-arabinofuranosidase